MLGVCCHFLEAKVKPRTGETVYVNRMDERGMQLGRLQAGRYSDADIRAVYVNNARNLAAMLPVIRGAGIRLFRVSSSLFPLADLVDPCLWDNDEVRGHLREAGEFVLASGMRVTTHPGQFCVLSSDSDKVADNAVQELAMHAWMFDSMGLGLSPKWAINIHGGKRNRLSALVERIKSLPDNIRRRLTLENDETCYTVVQLLQVFMETEVPVCFDSHHHTFNEGLLDMDEAYRAAHATWPKDITPLQHIANTSPELVDGSFTDRRKHSDYIHHVPKCQLDGLRNGEVDVEVEAKLKNVAVLEASKKFSIPL